MTIFQPSLSIRLITFACIVLLSSACSSIEPEQALMADPHWNQGQLDNGLKYHFYYMEGQPIEIRLLVKAGSLQESLRQFGYAHFLEHMAFNGSKHFPKQKLIEQLEQAGLSANSDINAYTSYDVTSYKLSLPSDSTFDSALLWFRDIPTELSLDPIEIEKEKAVVLGEIRLSNANETSVAEQLDGLFLNETDLGGYKVLGSEESIQNINRGQLLQYYHQWYVPNNSEIIIVGDISPRLAKEKIVEYFSDWAAHPLEHKLSIQINPTSDTSPVVFAVPSQDSSATALVHYNGDAAITTLADQRAQMADDFSYALIRGRLKAQAYTKNIPLIDIYAGSYPLFNVSYGFVMANYNEQDRLKVEPFLAAELADMRYSGVSPAELATELAVYQQALEHLDSNYRSRTSGWVIDQRENAILRDGVIQYKEDYRKNLTRFIHDVNLNDINALIKNKLNPKQQKLVFSLPTSIESEEYDTFPLHQNEQVMLQKMQQQNTPLTDTHFAQTTISPPEFSGNITRYEAIRSDLHCWTLDNGVKVWLKQMPEAEGSVYAKYLAPGGMLALDKSYNPASQVFIDSVLKSGLANLNLIELRRLLIEHDTTLYPVINVGSHGIELQTSKSNLETAFSVLHQAATKVNFSQPQFKLALSAYLQEKNSFLASPYGRHKYELNHQLYGEDSAFSILSTESFNQVTFSDIQDIYQSLFRQAHPFQLYIVADLNAHELQPYLEQFIANISYDPIVKQHQKVTLAVPQNELISKTSNEDSTVYGVYFTSTSEKSSSKQDITLTLLEKIINKKMFEQMREENGFDYSPSAGIIKSAGDANIELWFEMTLAPEQALEAQKSMNQFIRDLSKDISLQDMNTAKEQLRVDYQYSERYPQQCLDDLSHFMTFDYALNELYYQKKVINSITLNDINNAYKNMIGNGSHRLDALFEPKPNL